MINNYYNLFASSNVIFVSHKYYIFNTHKVYIKHLNFEELKTNYF